MADLRFDLVQAIGPLSDERLAAEAQTGWLVVEDLARGSLPSTWPRSPGGAVLEELLESENQDPLGEIAVSGARLRRPAGRGADPLRTVGLDETVPLYQSCP